ncbi:hypothetical protein [Pedobacter kyungheensis]|uniref:hypothetical protein n=1 Tax=Pedobacter kyungheensis TaxID=1069985 RepID=UPI000A80282A|nr:hypothetical protein [Pedobacter kyungheensis]
MAILHRKEEKIQAVLGRLPKKYTEEQFLEMFIKLYSKDWGKIKSAYTKQAQDKEPGTVINMPKPDVYLKQLLAIYLQNTAAPAATEVKEEVVAESVAEVKKAKAPAKKKETVEEADKAEPKKTKTPATKKAVPAAEIEAAPKKPKAAAKKAAEKK